MTDVGSDVLQAIEEAESAVRPIVEGQLREAAESDSSITAAIDAWNGSVGMEAESDPVSRAAARQANVLTNLVCYHLSTNGPPPESLSVSPVTPFRALDTPPAVDAVLDDLASTLRDRGRVDSSVLGCRYAAIIDEQERRTRGQFYTPAPLAKLVVRWALEDGSDDPHVLDPAAGTGTFQLAALDFLCERTPDVEPGSVLSRLVAVDVDDVALHLAALRLSAHIGGESVDAFDRRPVSFFDVEPGDGLATVDAIVGNPPFVRAGSLSPDPDHYRRHLEAMGSPGRAGTTTSAIDGTTRTDGEAPYAAGEQALSRRCDASVYFVTHATRFLRAGGRLGMVLPAKWLESDYGVEFRRFLVDHYDVHAVVGFDARTFDALVDTVLLLAERREHRAGRGGQSTPVRFVRLGGPVDVDESLELLRHGEPVGADELIRDGSPGLFENGSSRVVTRGHTTFERVGKCSPYLRAPMELLSLLEHPEFVPLGELAAVSRGVTTGANRFFILDEADRERWGVHPRFLRPALRSIRGVETRTLSTNDVEQSILDVHGFVSGPFDGSGDDPTECAKTDLRTAGYDSLVDYVEFAESEGWHEGRTCQARRVWFDLGPLPSPDAFVPKLLRERVFTIRNRAGAVPSNAIDCLSVHDDVDPDVLLGVLDSSLCRAMMEVWGRDEAGLLQLMTYETRTMPVPDVRGFTTVEAATVREAGSAIANEGADPDPERQAALDRAVLEALDMDIGAAEIGRLQSRLLRRRVDGGNRVEVPIS